MDAGGGSDNQDGRGDRMPPDEQEMRLGRARLARSGDPLGDQSGLSDGMIGGSSPRDTENDPGSSAAGVTPRQPITSPMASLIGGPESIDLAPRFRPWSEPATATAGPLRCHFLRSVGPDGRLTEAQRAAVPTHRCAAFGDPLPLSLRQQELVCLQRVHVSCPRYVRGTLLANETPSSPANDKARRRVPILSIVGVGLVVLALAVVAAAMLGLPPFGGGAIGPTAATVVVSPPPASPTSSAAAQPSSTATAAITASIAPSALPSAQPSATVKPTPAPTPIASAWPPGATASRMNLVVPCTGQANCYIYIVRGSGPPPAGNGSGVPDSLTNIATFFGVSVSDVNALNPWASAGIHSGDKLKIPPPTR